MSSITIPTTSSFATKNSDPEQVARLIAAALDPATGVRNEVTWDELLPIGIGYARGWLIVRRAEIEASQPTLIPDQGKWIAARKAEYDEAVRIQRALEDEAGTPEDERVQFEPFSTEQALGMLVKHLMLDEHCSWGEAMCRLDMSEGRVRALFRMDSIMTDIGLRPAQRGGRWLMDNPTLYTEYRRKEGAVIAEGMKRSDIAPDTLLNAEVRLAEFVPEAKAASRHFNAELEQAIAQAREQRLAAARAKRAQKKSPKA
jgi:hypothetical protein